MRATMLVPLLVLAAGTARAQAGPSNGSPAAKSTAGAIYAASSIQWGAVPPVLPAGAQIAVLQGNPFSDGVYTLRLKMPDGYTIPPHFHPTDEMVTVVSGDLLFGMGNRTDERAATSMRDGAFVTAAARMPHYVIARGETVVQVHGTGPFAITYVNAKDDPRTTSSREP